MSRTVLVDAILAAVAQNHPKVGLTNAAANTAVEAITNAFKHSLKTNGTFNLFGFGSFRTAARAARSGVNPRTGEKIAIPATQTVTFKASPALKSEAAAFPLPAKRGGSEAKIVTGQPPLLKKVAKPAVTKTSTKKAKQ